MSMSIQKYILFIGAFLACHITLYAMEEGNAQLVPTEEHQEAYDRAYNAVLDGETASLQRLLRQYPVRVTECDGANLMVTAIQSQNLPALKILLSSGYSPNHNDARGTIDTTRFAVSERGEWVEMHVSAPSSVPLYEAAKDGYIAAMRLLLDAKDHIASVKYKADVNMQNADGETPLMGIICSEINKDFNKCEEGLVLLLERGANPRIVDNCSNNVLHKLMQVYRIKGLQENNNRRYLAILKSLLQAGADNVADYPDKYTPLHCAVEYGWYEGARAMITFTEGKNIAAPNWFEWRPLDIAYDLSNADIIHLLEHWPYECAKEKMCQFGATATGNPNLVKMLQRRESSGKKHSYVPRKQLPGKQVSGKDENEN